MLIRQGENGETCDQIDAVALVNDQRHVTRLITLFFVVLRA